MPGSLESDIGTITLFGGRIDSSVGSYPSGTLETVPSSDVYPETDDDTFNPYTDMLEVAGEESPGSAQFGVEQSSNSRTYIIDSNKARSCARYWLGWANADLTMPYELHRENPKCDPKYPFLRANHVDIHEIGTDAALAKLNIKTGGFTLRTIDQAPIKIPSIVFTPPSFPTGGIPDFTAFPDVVPWMTKYKFALVTVGFSTYPRYHFYRDEDPNWSGDEWDRNVFWEPTASLDILSAQGGANPQLQFAETNGLPTGPSLTTKLPAPTGLFMPKVAYCANWYRVPRDYIFDDNLNFVRLQNAIGRVNLTEWDGWRKGTALLMGAKVMPFTGHLWTGSSDSGTMGAASFYNVQLYYKWMDPEIGKTSGRDPSAPYGWQVMPFKDGLYYYATRDGSIGGAPYLPYYEMRDLLKHQAAP